MHITGVHVGNGTIVGGSIPEPTVTPRSRGTKDEPWVDITITPFGRKKAKGIAHDYLPTWIMIDRGLAPAHAIYKSAYDEYRRKHPTTSAEEARKFARSIMEALQATS